MNQAASTPGADLVPDTTDIFTAGNLLLIAVLALLAIAMIVWGVRNKARRRVADKEVAAHNAEIEDTPKAAPALDAEDGARPLSSAEANAPTELLFERIPDAPAPPVAAAPTRPAPPPAPVAKPEPVAAEQASPHADAPITQLKGLGPKLATRLGELGITTVGQLAALTDDEAAALDARLGPFTGRMARDRWQEQARFLAAGDTKGFEAVFGRL